VFDKEKMKKRPGNVGDYACERYFYDVDFDALKREKLEQDPDLPPWGSSTEKNVSYMEGIGIMLLIFNTA
jgi:hypothetical protein